MRIAKDKNGILIDIEDANTDESYYCVECGIQLIKKNKIDTIPRQRDIHFAHSFDCPGNKETYLHAISKLIIASENSINLPELGLFQYNSTKTESALNGVIPDIQLITKTKIIAIEIFVTHKTEISKIKNYSRNNITAIEIDLSDLDKNSSLQLIRDIVINSIDKKYPLHKKLICDSPIEVGKKDNNTIFWVLLFIGIVLYFFIRAKNSKKKKYIYNRYF